MEGKKISQLTPDTSPTTDDFIVSVDGATMENKRVDLGSLPVSNSTVGLLDTKVNKAGDTMTGNLIIPAPTQPTHATTRSYVDNRTPIYGLGFPNGVVSASVGSTYIDTNATNGILQWVKASGSGTTGWKILTSSGDMNTVVDVRTSTVDDTSRYVTAMLDDNYRDIDVSFSFRGGGGVPASTPFRVEFLDASGNVLSTNALSKIWTGSGITTNPTSTNPYAMTGVTAAYDTAVGNISIKSSDRSYEFKFFKSEVWRSDVNYQSSGRTTSTARIRGVRIVMETTAGFFGIRLKLSGSN